MKLMQVIDFDTFGTASAETALRAAEYADVIWFRIKEKEHIYKQAEKIRKALPEAYLVLSLDAEAAARLGYEAVQLGALSDVSAVRADFPSLDIGYSAHSADEILSVDADFYTLSPVFHTVKDYEVKPIGAVDVYHLGRRIFALGGINSDNINELYGKGYEGAAGISFINKLAEIKEKIRLW
jgi:thiamine-phosphate pyrophosphorylase